MATAGPTRILIVDDSAVMRSLLRAVVCADPSLEVAGTAADGVSALNSIGLLRPDLILLDVEMPVMDGLETLRELRRRGYTIPVIMCSAVTQRGAKVTLEALAGGASDYVAKPSGQANREAAIKTLGEDLGPKINALIHRDPGAVQAASTGTMLRPQSRATGALTAGGFPSVSRTAACLPMEQMHRKQAITSNPTVLAIGVSTGGPTALEVLLPALPADFPLPIVIVQHMPEVFTRIFAERLDGRSNLRVSEAVEGAPVRAGTIAVARGNWHMEVLAASHPGSPPTLHLTQGPLENHCRPAVDVLFRSVAAVYGAGSLALVLTGMGSDGLEGCRMIREQGGTVLAQDQASSTVWGMPGAVANAGLAQRVLPLKELAAEIVRLANRAHSEARELREAVIL